MAAAQNSAAREPASLQWLGGRHALADGSVAWGTPWPRGSLRPDEQFRLVTEGGQEVPIQSWPLAYWPDGSLKWSGHALSGPLDAQGLRLEPGGAPKAPSHPVVVEDQKKDIRIRTGNFECVIPKDGENLISSASLKHRRAFTNLRLVCLVRDTPEATAAEIHAEKFTSRVEKVSIEQNGPVRTVVRIEGSHVNSGGRTLLPFTVRLYCGAGAEGIRVVHSFVFDGDAEKDFISGLGLVFEAPLEGDLHNRHIRFTSEGGGLWSEAVRNLPGWAAHKFKYGGLFADQLAGQQTPSLRQMDKKSREQLETVPAWDDFKLVQTTADQFSIQKRTGADSSWLPADHGGRSDGLAYVGGASGGVLFGMRDFWQRHPSALEIERALGDAATATVWLWSPEAPPMDLRHYSDEAHGLEIQYEDITEGYSTPYGIARTSEMALWCAEATPTAEKIADYAAALRDPPRLHCAPERYRDAGVFGPLGLPDRSTPTKALLEDQHNALIGFYRDEIEQRHWYGFWHYGDVRHTYDNDRHAWRYDVGGYAWANSELAPDVWFWQAFLRSGRADIFRMAEAMTRHTGEVDVYHIGPMKGLGSRHNVSHWGGGAKEARISQALYRRYYYYLTTDERTGDLMHEVVDADKTTVAINPLRKILRPPEHPTYARTGPDWFSFAANWLAEWERTGDTRWRDKIVTGLKSIAAAPNGMISGPAFGYDPATGVLHHVGGDYKTSYHLVTIFGGAELAFELDALLDVPEWTKTWLRFCEIYNASPERREEIAGMPVKDSVFGYPVWHARLTAFAAYKTGDVALAERAWNEFLYSDDLMPLTIETVEPPQVLEERQEIPWISTNHASQWALNFFELLALAGDAAPEEFSGRWAEAQAEN